MIAEQKVLTTRQATEYLQTTKQTLLKMVHDGKIRGNLVGRGYCFLQDELDKYLRGETEGKAVTE